MIEVLVRRVDFWSEDAAPAGSAMQYVRSVRDILLGLYKGNERKLGDWGFEVNSSAQAGSKPAPPSA